MRSRNPFRQRLLAANPRLTRSLELSPLILWALMSIVTLKYVIFLLRADNQGEGGTLTLMALAQRGWQGNRYIIVMLGMLGAALFYGDAVITPAISVLSAVEGLKVIAPAFDPYIVPLSLVILVALFVVQSRGTAKVAAFFGPIMALWFVALAIGGLISHCREFPISLQLSIRVTLWDFCSRTGISAFSRWARSF